MMASISNVSDVRGCCSPSVAETRSLSIMTSLTNEPLGVALPKERFADPVTSQMICMKCNNVSPDPVYLLCCHDMFYCYQCLVPKSKDEIVLCPSCGLSSDHKKALTRSDKLRNAIYNLKVKCEYPDCDMLSTIDTITNHSENCVFKPYPCENPGCSVTCLFKDWVWHCKVKCPKRQIQCIGSCHKFISADQIDEHDCDKVLEDLVQYQHDEVEILSKLLKDQHEEHIRRGRRGSLDLEISRRISEKVVPRDLSTCSLNRVNSDFSNQSEKIKLLNLSDDFLHDELGHEVHGGTWRCSVIECDLPYQKHDYTKAFPDGNRHIFFWDCCLDHDKDSKKCDLMECFDNNDDHDIFLGIEDVILQRSLRINSE